MAVTTAVRRGTGDVTNDALAQARRQNMSIGDMIKKGLIIPSAGGVLIGGTFIAGYSIKEGGLFDGANKLVEDINLVVGLGAARAEARTQREGIAATLENWGTILYEFTGSSAVLWFINKMRKLQHKLQPLTRTGNGNELIEADKYEPSAIPRATGTPVTGLFNEQAFKTEFAGAVAKTDLFTRLARSHTHGPGPGVLPDAARAVVINRTIQGLDMDELVKVLEQSTTNQRVLDGLKAIQSNDELSDAFDKARQTNGVESITDLFSKLATGNQPVAAVARAALLPTPGS